MNVLHKENTVVIIMSSTEAEDLKWDLHHLKVGNNWRVHYPRTQATGATILGATLSSTERLYRELGSI